MLGLEGGRGEERERERETEHERWEDRVNDDATTASADAGKRETESGCLRPRLPAAE
jgi:hypothetical protein